MNLKQAFNNAGIVKTITIPYSRVWVGVDFVHTGMCLQRGRKVPSKSTKDKGLRAKKISNAKALTPNGLTVIPSLSDLVEVVL